MFGKWFSLDYNWNLKSGLIQLTVWELFATFFSLTESSYVFSLSQRPWIHYLLQSKCLSRGEGLKYVLFAQWWFFVGDVPFYLVSFSIIKVETREIIYLRSWCSMFVNLYLRSAMKTSISFRGMQLNLILKNMHLKVTGEKFCYATSFGISLLLKTDQV